MAGESLRSLGCNPRCSALGQFFVGFHHRGQVLFFDFPGKRTLGVGQDQASVLEQGCHLSDMSFHFIGGFLDQQGRLQPSHDTLVFANDLGNVASLWKALSALLLRPFTSEYIFDETVTLIRRKIGWTWT